MFGVICNTFTDAVAVVLAPVFILPEPPILLRCFSQTQVPPVFWSFLTSIFLETPSLKPNVLKTLTGNVLWSMFQVTVGV